VKTCLQENVSFLRGIFLVSLSRNMGWRIILIKKLRKEAVFILGKPFLGGYTFDRSGGLTEGSPRRGANGDAILYGQANISCG
jgi:hypothetical protein